MDNEACGLNKHCCYVILSLVFCIFLSREETKLAKLLVQHVELKQNYFLETSKNTSDEQPALIKPRCFLYFSNKENHKQYCVYRSESFLKFPLK